MHITIFALGSHGDVFPFAVLGKALQKARHQVRLISFENFKPLADAHALDFYPIPGDAQALMGGAAGQVLADSGSNVLRGLQGILGSFGALADEYTRALTNPFLRETDLLVNQTPVFGDELGEWLCVPTIEAGVIPLIRTHEFVLPLFPQWNLGRAYNALSYRLAEQMAWQPFHKVLNRWRVDVLGLPRKPFLGGFNRKYAQQRPTLAAYSPQIVPRPADWGENIHQTGFWFPQDDLHWQPPADLERFLAAGDPPIFVGFGSMPMRDPAQVTKTVVQALLESGQRGLLSGGWGALGGQDLPDSILKIGYVPYTWLLPRVAGSVIHGGSGSTASALRSGKPTLVVPFVMDQFYWGRRVFELGGGPKSIPFKKLNVESLTWAIIEMVRNTGMRQKAMVLGEKIRAETGIENAVAVIEKVGAGR